MLGVPLLLCFPFFLCIGDHRRPATQRWFVGAFGRGIGEGPSKLPVSALNVRRGFWLLEGSEVQPAKARVARRVRKRIVFIVICEVGMVPALTT